RKSPHPPARSRRRKSRRPQGAALLRAPARLRRQRTQLRTRRLDRRHGPPPHPLPQRPLLRHRTKTTPKQNRNPLPPARHPPPPSVILSEVEGSVPLVPK